MRPLAYALALVLASLAPACGVPANSDADPYDGCRARDTAASSLPGFYFCRGATTTCVSVPSASTAGSRAMFCTVNGCVDDSSCPAREGFTAACVDLGVPMNNRRFCALRCTLGVTACPVGTECGRNIVPSGEVETYCLPP